MEPFTSSSTFLNIEAKTPLVMGFMRKPIRPIAFWHPVSSYSTL
jgi:hypothetical protein